MVLLAKFSALLFYPVSGLVGVSHSNDIGGINYNSLKLFRNLIDDLSSFNSKYPLTAKHIAFRDVH